MYICIYVYVNVFMYLCICIYVYMYICTYVYMYMCIYVHLYRGIYTFGKFHSRCGQCQSQSFHMWDICPCIGFATTQLSVIKWSAVGCQNGDSSQQNTQWFCLLVPESEHARGYNSGLAPPSIRS